MRRKWWSVALLPLAFAGALGCAEERDPINRVQPNALAKSFFVGEDLVSPMDDPEFWYQGSLIDVGYGAAQDGLFTSTWATNTTRIKWEITEDLLIGRITYQRIANSDGKGDGPTSTDGQIAVAFRITSHFDIRRDYNPSTGEEYNVIDENASDRPWYERPYFRVDWSQNLNTEAYDYDTLALVGIFGGVKYEPLAYYVNDPHNPDAPFFDVASGYFDVTTKAFAEPQQIDLSAFGWGIDSFPACFLDADFMNGSAPAGNCNPVEITVRQAFRRVVDNDYEPADWDGNRFQSYGAFTTDRYGYSRNYGMSDDMWHRFITRYNIWERSHYYADPAAMTGSIPCYTPETTPYGADPHRDGNADGTDDECQAVTDITGIAGSRCDTFKQKCTLPFRLRKEKPLAWYYTEGSNPEFFESTEWATNDWDAALRKAVVIARYSECRTTGGDAATCTAAFPDTPFGQEDDNLDLQQLTTDVDACRHGLSHPEFNGDDAACTALADSIGGRRGITQPIIALAKKPEMIVLCHSPVEAKDPPLCGGPRLPENVTTADCIAARQNYDTEKMATCEAALSARIGDLRFHQVNVLTAPQTPSAWGIYVDSEDPTDGEKISASINVWSYVNDLWSQGIVDRIRLITGELDVDDVTEAEYVKDFAEASEAAGKGGVAGTMTKDQLDRRMAAAVHITPEKLQSLRASQALQQQKPEFAKFRKELTDVRFAVDAPSSLAAKYVARRNAVAGTQTEAELLTPEMQQLAGVDGMPMSDGVIAQASPLRGMNPSFRRQFAQFKEMALAERGACIMQDAPAPISIDGLAKALLEKFPAATYDGKNCTNTSSVPAAEEQACRDEQHVRSERMRKFLANRAQYAVIAHEMGHSIGMRHNFVSSSDAYNYRPQYWQLRTKDGTVTSQCTDLDATGENCVGPRYFDPVTDNEANNLIWGWMHSSIMDYAGEATQDMIGIAAFDFAAATMFYGDAVAVYADDTYKVGTKRGVGVLSKMDSFGGILGFQPVVGDGAGGTVDIHYSQINRQFQSISNCAAVNADDFKPDYWDEGKFGVYHPVLDGLIVDPTGNGQYTRCRQQPVDYIGWRKLRMPSAGEQAIVGFYSGGPSIDPDKRLRVPYGFATDRWADLGNVSVYRHDNGADAYEIFNFLATAQEVNHIFDAYRRGKQSFSVRGASNRILDRYNTKIRDGAKGLALIANIYKEIALTGIDYESLWGYIADSFYPQNIIASTMAFDFFTRLMARPEIGPHVLRNGVVSVDDWYNVTAASNVATIPNAANGLNGTLVIGGKLMENQLASGKGEYDSEYTINAGSYYDKAWTAMLMTESVDNFISDSHSDFYDDRYRAVSLADLFPEGYRRWLGNNLTGDEDIKGARLASNSDGGPPLVDAQKYPTWPMGWPMYWGDDIKHCFSNDGTNMCGSWNGDDTVFNSLAPAATTPLQSDVGWGQQIFLINWTLAYLPENKKQNWINNLSLWMLGHDADPGFTNRIEFHDPYGKIFVAKTFGKETVFQGTSYERAIQKGVAARVLEYANGLAEQAYVVSDGPDLDNDGTPDWYEPVVDPATGTPTVKWRSDMSFLNASGTGTTNNIPGCNSTDSSQCQCWASHPCVTLENYVSVPYYLRQALADYGMGDPDLKGIYDAP